jgi:putative membrane protein
MIEKRSNADNNAATDQTSAGVAADTVTPPAVEAQSGAQNYVAEAAASDQFEIQSSELVLKQSKNREVRAFAQQMVDDHTASTTRLMSVVSTAGLTAPGTGLHAKQQNDLAALRDAGASMDQLYITQQRAAHAEAIALHQGAATSNGAMPASLTAFASEVLPTIQAHARMLDDMKPVPTAS